MSTKKNIQNPKLHYLPTLILFTMTNAVLAKSRPDISMNLSELYMEKWYHFRQIIIIDYLCARFRTLSIDL